MERGSKEKSYYLIITLNHHHQSVKNLGTFHPSGVQKVHRIQWCANKFTPASVQSSTLSGFPVASGFAGSVDDAAMEGGQRKICIFCHNLNCHHNFLLIFPFYKGDDAATEGVKRKNAGITIISSIISDSLPRFQRRTNMDIWIYYELVCEAVFLPELWPSPRLPLSSHKLSWKFTWMSPGRLMYSQ